MLKKRGFTFFSGLFLLQVSLAPFAATCPPHSRTEPALARETLARQAFGNDSPWYLANIPFFEIDDQEIQDTYYYRWKVFHAHMRDLGRDGNDVTEFLPSVSWARHPYEDLNDSSSFHLLEGRWLRDASFIERFVDHLYSGGGNDRHFSESVAAATFAWTQVTGDVAPALRHLDSMQSTYNLWDDHFDAVRNLYWVEPLADATEYTIASIDASGAGFTETPDPGNDGFTGGFAFRPTINAFQFGNARAIAALAHAAGEKGIEADYTHRAEKLRLAMLDELWNPTLQHFADIYQRSTPTVKAGDSIRGRELAGLVPWQFHLPPQEAKGALYAAGWQHLLAAQELAGPHGLRTVEPSYPRYMVQYRYDSQRGEKPRPECQWNGPSWPFQTSQVLSGLTNLLDDYPAATVAASGATPDDFVRLLRQYSMQHRRGTGLDLQEDYNPDTGEVIVGLDRSHHYLHSTYVDVVLTGLVGIRPRTDDVLELAPLLPRAESERPGTGRPIGYFALTGLRYHGHDISVFYDANDTRYRLGAGLSVFVDGSLVVKASGSTHLTVPLPPVSRPTVDPTGGQGEVNVAVNVWGRSPSAHQPDLPIASASSSDAETDPVSFQEVPLYEPLDGRTWFFPEVSHGWSPAAADEAWYTVDLRQAFPVTAIELALFTDGQHYSIPKSIHFQIRTATGWEEVLPKSKPAMVQNGITRAEFPAVSMREIRIVFPKSETAKPIRLVSLRVLTPRVSTLSNP